MCEVGVKENEGQTALFLRRLIFSNSNVGCADYKRRIKAWL